MEASPHCLLLSRQPDPHTDVVAEALTRKGTTFARLNIGNVEFLAHVSRTVDNVEYLHTPDGRIRLQDVRTVWLRRPEAVGSVLKTPDGVARAVEKGTWVRTLWHVLEDRTWINPYDADRRAHYKPYQLSMALSQGLPVPRTVITNDSSVFASFFDRCNGMVVYKTHEPCVREDGSVFTSVVTAAHRDRFGEQIAFAPCIFQEYIDVAVDLRVTAVGRELFAAEIIRAPTAAGPDWRRAARAATFRAVAIEDRLQRSIHGFLEQLNLSFGCLDFVRSQTGELFFLEINPAGQWYGVEQLTGLPILSALTEALSC